MTFNIDYIILEDDIATVNLVTGILKEINNFNFINFAAKVDDSINLINNNKFDLCFADVHLLDGKAFDVFSKVNNLKFDIIFITGYEKYALRAIKMSAIEYILKPINEVELKNIAINYINKRKHTNDINFHLAHYIHNNNLKQKIILPCKDEYKIVLIDEIDYIESDGCYSIFILNNSTKKITSSRPVKYYEDILFEYKFLRIHHKYLVNFQKIKSLLKGYPLNIKLNSGKILPVTRYNKTELIKLIV